VVYALYFEFMRGDEQMQYLFVPSVMLGTVSLPPTLASKHLDRPGSRRQWAVNTNSYYQRQSGSATLPTLLAEELPQLEGLSAYITSAVGDPSWILAWSFPVEVTQSDLLALKETPTRVPTDLNDRVRTIRGEVANRSVLGI